MARSHGEGTICQRKDGRWHASLMVNGIRRSVYGRSRQEAAHKLAELKRQAQSTGTLADPGKRTVADLLAAWLETAEPNLSPKTLSDYRHICGKHILPTLGAVRLARLEPITIERLLANIMVSGRRRMAQRVCTVLHDVCVQGMKWRWLPENVMDRVQRPAYKPVPRTLWTREQVTRFLAAVTGGDGGHYACLFGFLLASGCRIGEALGLRWSDVDLDASTVRIERQITEVRGRPTEAEPKTAAGVRSVALPSWGVELLRRHKVQVAEWRLQSGHAHNWPERVFPTSLGTVPLQGNVKRGLHVLCDRLALPRIRTHDLRHISLSLLARQGYAVKDLQRRAGHATARTTLEIYTHVLDDGDLQAAHLLDELAKEPQQQVQVVRQPNADADCTGGATLGQR
jgi:integrase